MENTGDILQWVSLVADLIIAPLFGVLWGMNVRLSRIEGHLAAKLKGE